MTTTNLPTDLPEGHLQIGETVFYQFFQDMDMIPFKLGHLGRSYLLHNHKRPSCLV